MALSKEQIAELAELEAEARDEAKAESDATQEQHFEAMKLRKKYSSNGKKHGRDFGIAETKVGNFVLRKPLDTEIDPLLETPDDRPARENFALKVLLEPTADKVKPMFSDEPGLANALCDVALDLARITVAENAKK